MDGARFYEGLELLNDAVGEIDTPWLNADEDGIFQFYVIFEQLVGQALDSDGQLLFVQDDLQGEFFIKIGQAGVLAKKERPALIGCRPRVRSVRYLPPPNLKIPVRDKLLRVSPFFERPL